MRTIKFRIWDNEQNKFLSHKDQVEVLGMVGFNDERMIWSQFTGLTDKSGREIFEGDIVHCEDEMYAFDTMFNSADTHPIIFENGAFRYDGVPLADMVTGAHPRICEVVGNIYEHPELLDN